MDYFADEDKRVSISKTNQSSSANIMKSVDPDRKAAFETRVNAHRTNIEVVTKMVHSKDLRLNK